MSNLNNTERKPRGPEYRFTEPGTLLFVTGVPLAGKSTIAPALAASIRGCALQNMDILRILAQEFDGMKPEAEREPTLNYGSCDSYAAIGDGSYSPESLVEGYRRYSRAVFRIAELVIPKMEAQGAQAAVFEGVQLLPSIVAPHLKAKNKLIVVTSDTSQLAANRQSVFGNDPLMSERYSAEHLMILQGEILDQAQQLPEETVFRAENTGDYAGTLTDIVSFLHETNVIERLAI